MNSGISLQCAWYCDVWIKWADTFLANSKCTEHDGMNCTFVHDSEVTALDDGHPSCSVALTSGSYIPCLPAQQKTASEARSVAHLVVCLPNMHKSLFDPQHGIPGHTSVILSLGGSRQEDHKSLVILGYPVSLKLAWAKDSVSKIK
jgi:hypothetical protein